MQKFLVTYCMVVYSQEGQFLQRACALQVQWNLFMTQAVVQLSPFFTFHWVYPVCIMQVNPTCIMALEMSSRGLCEHWHRLIIIKMLIFSRALGREHVWDSWRYNCIGNMADWSDMSIIIASCPIICGHPYSTIIHYIPVKSFMENVNVDFFVDDAREVLTIYMAVWIHCKTVNRC